MNNLLILCLTFFTSIAFSKEIRPQNNYQFKKTSVRIYSSEFGGGGTGSILRSNTISTDILTNKHICRIIEQGGTVRYANKSFPIISYKKYARNDLCLVKILGNLGVSTRVSKLSPRPGSTTYMSGHPRLLPHIVNKGHLSDNMTIKLAVGAKSCSEDNPPSSPQEKFQCAFFGNILVFSNFESSVVSNLIQPGNSGSAVFNTYGEIVGVAFAGSGKISYGFVVPHKYVVDFLKNEKKQQWVEVGTKVDNQGLDERFFNHKQCISVFTDEICNAQIMRMVWSN